MTEPLLPKSVPESARRRWLSIPAGMHPKAMLFLFHGTHEHCGRYQDFALNCTSRGIHVYACDFHGHGEREGVRGDFGGLDDAIAESIDLVVSERAHAPDPSIPFIILGHSLGSMVAYLTAHKLATTESLPSPNLCVLSGFAIDSVSPPFGIQALVPVLRATPVIVHKVVRVLSKLQPHGPACPLPPASELTHDTEEVVRCLGDRLHHHGWICNRTGLALMDGRARCNDLLPQWGRDYPFLFVHGGADALCPVSGPLKVMAASPQTDKELKVFPGLFHEVFFETPDARAMVQGYILDWIETRLAGPRARSRL